ncbi:hypothetical protein K7432_017817 [Basidiobolus ranarum]|uniref:Uncharacterized protein n=1 Tax=Basidiobolus ranarum TaxID=34480 RepID=A0ABR2WCW6_9FUNG
MVAASELESSSQKEITNIPTFNGEDFRERKFEMSLVLEGKHVWEVVQPDEDEETSEEESTDSGTETKKPTHEEARAAFKEKDRLVFRKISLYKRYEESGIRTHASEEITALT